MVLVYDREAVANAVDQEGYLVHEEIGHREGEGEGQPVVGQLDGTGGRHAVQVEPPAAVREHRADGVLSDVALGHHAACRHDLREGVGPALHQLAGVGVLLSLRESVGDGDGSDGDGDRALSSLAGDREGVIARRGGVGEADVLAVDFRERRRVAVGEGDRVVRGPSHRLHRRAAAEDHVDVLGQQEGGDGEAEGVGGTAGGELHVGDLGRDVGDLQPCVG